MVRSTQLAWYDDTQAALDNIDFDGLPEAPEWKSPGIPEPEPLFDSKTMTFAEGSRRARKAKLIDLDDDDADTADEDELGC
jgi:hypothetical protein